jgi:RNA polymerase sigma-70 factor (ECF subfamily)
MASDSSFHAFLTQLRAGDEAAAAECFRRYARRLVGLAQTRLSRQLRSKVDAEDVVQSVFRSFFVRNARGEYDLGDWGGLWGLLVVITLRKCGRQAAQFRSARRDVSRERAPAAGAAAEAVADEPTPAEAAALADTVRVLLEPFPERDRQIIGLRLQGYSVPEISARVQRTERTVFRVLEKVRERLEALCAAD